MKQISIARRNQAIKLILDGLPFDEVSRKSGVSKGSVVNLYGQLKDGNYSASSRSPRR
jgi:transposase